MVALMVELLGVLMVVTLDLLWVAHLVESMVVQKVAKMVVS